MTKPARGSRFSADSTPSRHVEPKRALGRSARTAGPPTRALGGAARALVGLLDLPPQRLPRGRRFRQGVVEVAGAAVAGSAAWWIWSTVGRTGPAMQVLVVFGALVAVCLLFSAAMRLRLTHQPPPRTRLIDGRLAIGVRARAGEHWLEVVVDSALVLTCLGVLIADAAHGGRWLPWSVLLLVPALWFGGLATAAAMGRRNPEAVWVVDDDLVHESGWGRERVPLASCTALSADAAMVTLRFAGPIARTVCPRPWRAGLPAPDEVRIDTAELGLSAADLHGWFARVVPPGPHD